jgi:AbrB family looped-hinge helix DNA binding protein
MIITAIITSGAGDGSGTNSNFKYKKHKIQTFLILKRIVVYGECMEVSITTISKNGQIVIPFDIRKALGNEPSEKFLVVSEGDTIVLKRLKKERLKKELENLFTYFSDTFDKEGITKEDVNKEIQSYRKKKRLSHESNG